VERRCLTVSNKEQYMGKKIAMIGAGSVVFCKTLMADIMATPALEGSEFALMSRTEPKLRAMEEFGNRMLKDNRVKGRVWATLDRREALKDADFVVVMIQVGGVEAFEIDWKIPLKYKVDQCVGDTMGPGGVFRAMRSIPVLLEIARDMREVSRPGAIMLQYANPMAGNCLALGKASDISFVGLCHGVQTTIEQIAQFIEVPKDEIVYTCGGINHMDWFLTLTRNGEDLYPKLAQAIEKPAIYKSEKVRGEVFRHFGYFMTETTGHLAEYVPWFRKTKAALDTYCDEPGFGGQSGAYFNWCDTVAKRYEGKNQLDWESTKLGARSVEYCSYIIEAVATGIPFKFMGNVRNDGYITNLPSDCCVEVPTFADETGLHPMRIGRLPTQCAALCMTNVNVQLLAAEAGINGDTEALVQAISLDPLTAAVCTLKEIRDMTAEMLEAERRWLPQFKGKKVTPKPAVHIPANVKAIELAQDPAQAILKRFMDLAAEKK
jgi:alpha-galactosidase